MTTIKANQINQLLDGRRVRIRERMNACRIYDYKPLEGWLIGAVTQPDNRVRIAVKLSEYHITWTYLPQNWQLDIDLETPRYE